MISGWLVKVILGLAITGFLVIEIGSPLIARAQVDDAAHQVADEAALRLETTYTQQTLTDACAQEAATLSVEVKTCEVKTEKVVEVTVSKHARSFLFDKISYFKHWYDVEASATATVR